MEYAMQRSDPSDKGVFRDLLADLHPYNILAWAHVLRTKLQAHSTGAMTIGLCLAVLSFLYMLASAAEFGWSFFTGLAIFSAGCLLIYVAGAAKRSD